jgi:hypothetical protein
MKTDNCSSCGEEMPENECPKSEKPCGHHCNHSWSHDSCCWCGKEFGEIENPYLQTDSDGKTYVGDVY